MGLDFGIQIKHMIDPKALLYRLRHLPARFPITLGGIFIGTRYVAGDAVTQYYERCNARMSWDWPRSLVFGTFGVYVGVAYAWVLLKSYSWFVRWLNCHRSIIGPVIEGVYFFPLYYFPMFYILQDIRSPGPFTFVSAYHRYKKNIFQDMLNWLKFWPLPVAFGFACLPNHMIPIYLSIVGFLWVLILSSNRGELQKVELTAFDKDVFTAHLRSNPHIEN